MQTLTMPKRLEAQYFDSTFHIDRSGRRSRRRRAGSARAARCRTRRARAASRCPRSTCGPPRRPRAAPWPSPPRASRARCTCAPLERPPPPGEPPPGEPPPLTGPLRRFVLGVWARRGDTPVVRASGRELSFVLLGGILMCYLLTFLLVLRPTDALCTAQRWVPAPAPNTLTRARSRTVTSVPIFACRISPEARRGFLTMKSIKASVVRVVRGDY